MSDTSGDNEAGHNMTLVEHLVELRNRVLRAVLAVLLVFCCLFYFANDIYRVVSQPLLDLLPANSSMVAVDVIALFFTPFKLTFFASLFLAVPYLLFQLWSFIAPGMYKKEKRVAIPLLLSSIFLFYLGVAFAYLVVFPLLFKFLLGIAPDFVTATPDITYFLNIAMKLFFAFGFAFEIPVATVLLIWMGVATPDGLVKKRPYIIVACFIIGMLLTPPDIFSQLFLALPMWLLFEVGIFFGRWVKAQSEDGDAEDSEEKTQEG